MNCAGVLLDDMVAAGHGRRIALRAPDGQCSYVQLQAQANRIANLLVRDMGLKPGNRVVLRGPNNPMMAACWLAVFKAGGICVGTMPLLRAKELTEIINKAEISHALCDKRLEAELKLALPGCATLKSICYWYSEEGNSLDRKAEKQSSTFNNVDTAAEDVALIAFTSGTTGKPKGTMHFHRDVVAMCDCFPRSCLKPAQDDIFIGTPPLAFTFGLGGLLCFPLRFGASTALVLDETGERCAPGQIGRLAVKGPTGCSYLADERQKSYVQNRWNVTGDAYVMDMDGYFHYQARTDDMIISAGYNIAGPEVEGVLLLHPAVAECGVIGAPDDDRGQIVMAFVALKPEYEAGEAMTRELQDHVKRSIAPYKYPRAIEYLPSLPRTETGKLQRF